MQLCHVDCRQLHLPESVSMSSRPQPRRQHLTYTFSAVSIAESLPRLVPPPPGHMTTGYLEGGGSLDVTAEPPLLDQSHPREVQTSLLHVVSAPPTKEKCHTSLSLHVSSPNVTCHTSSSSSLRVTSRAPKVTPSSLQPRESSHTSSTPSLRTTRHTVLSPIEECRASSSLQVMQTVSPTVTTSSLWVTGSSPKVACHASSLPPRERLDHTSSSLQETPPQEDTLCVYIPPELPTAHPLRNTDVQEELLLMRQRMRKYLQLKIHKKSVRF